MRKLIFFIVNVIDSLAKIVQGERNTKQKVFFLVWHFDNLGCGSAEHSSKLDDSALPLHDISEPRPMLFKMTIPNCTTENVLYAEPRRYYIKIQIKYELFLLLIEKYINLQSS